MKRLFMFLVCVIGMAVDVDVPAQTEHHRATHLGNPRTRFATPLAAPDDLRARFRDERLKPDFASVLRQYAWPGDVTDLMRAALTAEIAEVQIPVGSTLPFMSSRENGKAICLRNVLWAGTEPAPAYAFQFTSKGRRYRCVTPKACSNFFVEDMGVEAAPALALACVAPAELLSGRPVQVCLNVQNVGDATESKIHVRLSIPSGATLTRASDGGVVRELQVAWEVPVMEANAGQQLCAEFAMPEPGSIAFEALASGVRAKSVKTSCTTRVIGIPAILIDAVDLEDPVEIGKEVIYEIKVTNQGSAPGTNIRLVCLVPPGEEFVSGGGASAMQLKNSAIITEALPVLAPKAAAVWRVVVKATQAGDARFKIDLTSDQFERPIREEESTHLY